MPFLKLLCEAAHFGHLEFLELKGMDSSPKRGPTSASENAGWKWGDRRREPPRLKPPAMIERQHVEWVVIAGGFHAAPFIFR
jgi:hypothetical protein